MCDLGNALSEPDFSMVNLLGPSLPCKSLKPLTGIREVPVANCNNLDFCSASQLRMHCSIPLTAFSDEGKPNTCSPEVPDDLVLLCVPSIVSVLLPVFYINICDASNKELQFTLIKNIDEVWWDELVEACNKCVELFFHSFLDSPFGDKSAAS